MLLHLALLIMPASSEGQQRAAREFPMYGQERAYRLDPVDRERHIAPGGMIAVGLLTGAAAAAVGWYGGLHFLDSHAGAFWSAAALTTAAIPVSVHLANHSRGAIEPALGASAGVGLAGVLIMAARDNDADATVGILASYLAQVLVSVAIESRTSGSRAGR